MSQKKNKKGTARFRFEKYIYLIIGLLSISVGFNVFLLPNNIVFGNVSGLSVITKYFFNIDPSIFIFVSSILLLGVSYLVLGVNKTRASILGSILLPIFVKLTANLSEVLNFKTDDLLICAIFGGVLYGLGAGLVFKGGFTTGGTDIINQIISKYGKVSMGTALIMSDGLIVLCGGISFGLIRLMYSVVTLYIIGFLTDKVMLGISDSKAFYIITTKDEVVKKYIINELGHGVTVFKAKGGYTKEDQKVLFCVIPTKEYIKLKEGIGVIDPEAFFVVLDSYEFLGGE